MTPNNGLFVLDGVFYGRDAEIAAWVNERLGGGMVDTPFRALAIIDDTDPGTAKWVAGVIFFLEHPARDGGAGDITISVAAEEVFVRNIPKFRTSIRQLMSYVFEDRGLGRMSAEIDLSDDKVVQAAQSLGLKLEGRKRKMGRNAGDVGLFGLLKEEAKAGGFWYPVLDAKAAAVA